MGRELVKIRLTQINFVPSWVETDGEGRPISAVRTGVGQLAIDCNVLPEDIQKTLRDFIFEQVTLSFAQEKDEAKSREL